MEANGGTGTVAEEVIPETTSTVRIFVGGVGEKVTDDDLRKMFSSLGTIKDVEFMRSGGRSFAYINFRPCSDKSLSKLFSSYNGCVWKGGRLRLEKAKEHYMARLRREWEEDAEVPHKTDDELVAAADENKDTSKKSKLLTLENKQLQIFFPRLRKVKAVPYSGTGKHKYSFQRVEVPPLPVHFCDCEEHCVPSETAQVKQMSDFEDQAGIVKEEELDMMRSVMNKIFNKEVNMSSDHSKAGVLARGSSDHPIDDMPPGGSYADQEDDDDSDDDNLVINIGSGGNTKSGLVKSGSLENVIQAHHGARGLDKKFFPLYEAMSIIYANEGAKGTGAVTASEAKRQPNTPRPTTPPRAVPTPLDDVGDNIDTIDLDPPAKNPEVNPSDAPVQKPEVDPSVTYAKSTATKRGRDDTASSKYNPDIAEMKDHIKVMATAFAVSQAIASEAHGARGGMWPILNSMVSLSRKERMTAARLFHREPLLLSGFMETPDADKLEYLRYLIGADEDEP